MWEKIKNFFAVIGAVLSAVAVTLLCRRSADRRGSTDNTDGNRRIEEGFTECEERAGTIEERSNRITEGIERAEKSADGITEHLERAEGILREAIKRSEEGKNDCMDTDRCQ